MKKLIIILFCSVLGFNAFAQDWKAQLKEETVSIAHNQYVAEEYQLLKFPNGASLTMKMSANGPTADMSRDFFLGTYTTLSLFTMFGILQEVGIKLDDVEFEDVENPTSAPDIALDFNMTSNGLIMSITTEDGTEKEEMSWEEFFAEN